MDLYAIQQGLAAAAGTIAGLNTYPILPESITPPTFAPVDMDVDYHGTFGAAGLTEILFTCYALTSRGDTDAGRQLLADYISPTGSTSIRAAIEADKTLGGAASELIVEGVKGAGRLYEIGGVDYLGATFNVRVWA